MMDEGVLGDVDIIFGFYVDLSFLVGVVKLRLGFFFVSSSFFEVEIIV